MEVRLHLHHVELPSDSHGDIVRRMRSKFRRFADRIVRLDVALKDVNGPRGGRDKVCQVRAQLHDGRQLTFSDRSSEMRRAMHRCMQRARANIGQAVKRHKRRPRPRDWAAITYD